MPKTRKDFERIQREWESKSRRKLTLETKLRYWLANNQSDVYMYIFIVILFVLFFLAIWFFDLDPDRIPNF